MNFKGNKYVKESGVFSLAVILVFFVIAFCPAGFARASSFYWVGVAGANTSVATNWKTTNPTICGGGDAASVPGAGDIAIFDADCDNNAAINTALSVAGITMESGYTGTVTASSTIAVSGNMTVAGGTFRTAQAIDGSVTVSGTLLVDTGGTFHVRYKSLAVPDSGGAGQTITVGALTVNGTLNANGLGFGSMAGPGRSGDSAGSHGGEGWGYGGPGQTYGSITNPISLGSGGNTVAGGGSIIISSLGEVVVAGTISANGSNAASPNGAGAGGSINIAAPSLSGAGTISANGGSGAGTGAGGGGGRVSIKLTSGTTFGTATILARGGTGYHVSGPGTVYLEKASDGTNNGTLYIDNNNNDSNLCDGLNLLPTCASVISSSVTGTEVGDVVIRNAGVLRVDENQTLTVSGSWTNTSISMADLTAGTIIFDGSSSKTISSKTNKFYNVTFNNANGTWVLQEILDANNLIITAGTLNANSYSISATGTFENNGKLQLTGVENLSGLAKDTNSGTVEYTGSAIIRNSIWLSSATPDQIDTNDAMTVEVGMRFRADYDGQITGVRFYKSLANTGTHVGSLWTDSGTLLATVTFTGETSSGWQQMSFASPVSITANTTYVISYHTNVGHYSSNSGYFASTGVDSGHIRAPKDGTYGANGVYKYSAQSAFPDQTFESSNYWVDLVYNYATTPPLNYGNTYNNFIFNKTGETQTLAENLIINNNFTITAGTIDTSSYNITVGGDWSNSGTFIPNSNTVTLTSGTHALAGATTFNNLTINANNTVTFPANTTQAINGNFSCSGTAGNMITINSSVPGTKATLSKASGIVSCDYLSITDFSAEGGAVWHAGLNSTGTNYDGWLDLTVPDSTAPQTIIDSGSCVFETRTNTAVTISFACVDGSGSGCSSTLYCTDTTDTCTPDTAYTSPILIFADGTNFIRYYSIDAASNSETINSRKIVINKSNLVGGNNYIPTHVPLSIVPASPDKKPPENKLINLNIIRQVLDKISQIAEEIAKTPEKSEKDLQLLSKSISKILGQISKMLSS
jgi:hypothetical protein